MVLWDYCAERRARINNLAARKLFNLQGQNPYMATLGDEGDIYIYATSSGLDEFVI